MTYRELATVNQIVDNELSPESIEAIRNDIPKLNNWLDPWRERKLTKKIKNFLIQTKDYNFSAMRIRKDSVKPTILFLCLCKFYNAGWDISVDYSKTFKNVYSSDDTDSADYWFFENANEYHTFYIKFKKRDI